VFRRNYRQHNAATAVFLMGARKFGGLVAMMWRENHTETIWMRGMQVQIAAFFDFT
jgi:hypothetical protein